jgi:hypothetical protein
MECGEMPVINILMSSFELPQAQFQLLLLLILLDKDIMLTLGLTML